MSPKGLTITDVALFTDIIELQNEKFIGAHDDEKSKRKCVYRLQGFLVRGDTQCVSYIRKNGGKSGKTLLADRWYRCDVTGSSQMNRVERDEEMHNKVATVVSNDGGKGVICFYEAERRKDEEIEVIYPGGEIEKDKDGYCGSDTEDPLKYEPKGGAKHDDRRLYCGTCVRCKSKKIKCGGRYASPNDNEYQYTKTCPRCKTFATKKGIKCKECRYERSERVKEIDEMNKHDKSNCKKNKARKPSKTTNTTKKKKAQKKSAALSGSKGMMTPETTNTTNPPGAPRKENMTIDLCESSDEDSRTSGSKKKGNGKKNRNKKEKKDLNKNVDDNVDNDNRTSVIQHYHGPVHYVRGDMNVDGDIVTNEISGNYVNYPK